MSVAQEVLVIDGDESVRRGLDELLRRVDLMPTLTGDTQVALTMAEQRFFSVALVDLDTPSAGAGVALIAELHRRSPGTTVLMMTARRAFDAAVVAFRAGAADVIVKAPDQVDYLRQRMLEAAQIHRQQEDQTRLLEQTAELHEDLIKTLLDTFRRALDLEERSGWQTLPADEITSVLVVDDDGDRHEALQRAVDQRGTYRLQSLATGGEALDLASRERFQIVLVRDALPDLPGSMVVRSVKAQQPEAVVLLYRAPHGRQPGRIDVVDGARVIPFVLEFVRDAQIVERLDELRDAALAANRERRYLAAFRQQHFELLKRIAEVRQRLGRVAPRRG